MIQNQKGSVVGLLIVLFVAFLIIGVGFYLKNKTRVAIIYEGQYFSFDLGVPAKIVSKSTDGKMIDYYQTTPKNSSVALIATVYKPTSSNADLEESCKFKKLKATILGQLHTICNQNNVAYIANFENNGVWYQVAVLPEDRKSELKQKDVINLLESIKIN